MTKVDRADGGATLCLSKSELVELRVALSAHHRSLVQRLNRSLGLVRTDGTLAAARVVADMCRVLEEALL